MGSNRSDDFGRLLNCFKQPCINSQRIWFGEEFDENGSKTTSPRYTVFRTSTARFSSVMRTTSLQSNSKISDEECADKEILMGKNTMMKCAIRQMISEKPELEKLVNLVQGNVGFVLTNGDMKEIRDLVMTFKVPAAARSGAIAPVPVVVPAQNTGLGPEKTSFF